MCVVLDLYVILDVKNWRQNGHKNNNTSSHMFQGHCCIPFVALAFRSEQEVYQKSNPSVTYFCLALDKSFGGSGRKTTALVKTVSIPDGGQ